MAKVVTSQGLTEFVQSGKTEDMPDKPEIKPVDKAAAPPEEKAVEKPVEPEKADNEGLEADDVDLTEHVRKKINKKHRQMKEAQEAQADAEAFAKNQYDRARLAEERAATLEKQLQESKKPEAKEPELKDPEIKDFTDDKGQVRWTDYTKAVADNAAKKAVQEDRARQAQEQEARTRAQTEAAFKARLEKATSKYPDFMDKVGASQTQFPGAVLQYITESEYGPDLSYRLATDAETAEKISKLPPIRAIAEIGKLESAFEKPVEPVKKTEPEAQKTPERGGAPPPITPISGSGAGIVNTDPAKMSFKELRDYERMKRKKR